MNNKINVEKKVPLSGLSTFKIGGSASYLYRLTDKSLLRDVILYAKENSLPLFFLGGGSNVLFPDHGFSGLVIKLENKGIRIEELETGVFVTAEAGEEWDLFVAWTIEHNLFGLENLSGIPGSVGATPVQNIGAYGREVKDFIYSVEVFDVKTLAVKTLFNEECQFGYRDSFFKTEEGQRFIVLSVTWKLLVAPTPQISYKDLSEYFKDNISPTPKEVRDAVIFIRGKKFPNLKTHGTAGSFFKNIICERVVAENIKKDFPSLPLYPVEGDMVKISTAFVLDKVCGLKNFRMGNVGLFENQSLVVVNYGGASSDEVKKFVEEIKKIVKEKINLEIKEEVIVF